MEHLPPLDQLFTLGRPDTSTKEWPDYRALSFGPEHVPSLLRMLEEEAVLYADGEEAAAYAPIHIWRTLAQLGAVEAVEPLVRLMDELEEWDWTIDEFPRVFAGIGPAAIPALAAHLHDRDREPWGRVNAARCLEELAAAHPGARDEAVAALLAEMRWWARNDEVLNASLIDTLLDLEEREVLPLAEEAFAAGAVDEMLRGDWEDIQLELGLIPRRTTPRPRWNLPRLPEKAPGRAVQPAQRRGRPGDAKQRRKREREARRRNRRR